MAMESSLPVADRPRRPEWMKVRAPSADGRFFAVRRRSTQPGRTRSVKRLAARTSPSAGGRGTATFQILGDTCTRACRYCYVTLWPAGPGRSARAASCRPGCERRWRSKHVVVTSVDRDDVPDRGAGHYAATDPSADGRSFPEATIEVLDARLSRRRGAGATLGARSTTRCLQPQHRDRAPPPSADARSEGELQRCARAASPGQGVGGLRRAHEERHHRRSAKTNDEVVGDDARLRAVGVDVYDGQYLQPSAKHVAIDRWATPTSFGGSENRVRH